jgi:hypothetical protein
MPAAPSRFYGAPFEFTATAAIDVVEFTPADDKAICIMSIILKATSELQEAQEEWLEVEVQRGGTAMTTGSGGSGSAAPVALNSADSAAGVVYEAGNTTLATFTAGVTPFRDAFNVRVGAEIRFTPEEFIWCSQANGGMVVRMPNAPTDSTDFKGTVLVGEAP